MRNFSQHLTVTISNFYRLYSMKKLSILIVFLSFLGCKTNPQNTEEPFKQLTHFIDQYASNSVAQGNINSMSVGIYKNGNTYHNYYGEIDLGAKNRPNDSTLFEIASISKTFVGILMAKAVIDNKVSLDTDIRVFLPKPYPNLEYKGTAVTIKNLVTHTLGFKTPKKLKGVYDQIFSGQITNTPISYNINELFDELETVTLTHTPGTFYEYNNVGPDIAAYILEQLYKKPYKILLNDFFQEIGMTNSYLYELGTNHPYLINGYTESGRLATVNENPLLGGAAGIIATLPDLMTFMTYLLESNSPYIKEATRELFKNEDESLGYLWDVGHEDVEGFYYLKTGTSNGVQSVILLCPDSNYGQILLMNNTSEKATSDWLSLYGKIEYDLIKYPKLNLWSAVEPLFLKNPKEASKQYITQKKDTATYFSESDYLNRIGYSYVFQNNIEAAVNVFNLAISEDPENANLYDSLGEVYYIAKDYKQSKFNFEKSLKLNPKNTNAKDYITKLNGLLSEVN